MCLVIFSCSVSPLSLPVKYIFYFLWAIFIIIYVVMEIYKLWCFLPLSQISRYTQACLRLVFVTLNYTELLIVYVYIHTCISVFELCFALYR